MGSPPSPDFGRLLARLARALDAGGIPFMLIGGQAVLLHGEPRLTQGIDVTLGVGPSRLDDLLALCSEALIIHKLFAARSRDLEDAAGVERRKGPHLDWAHLERWCGEFARVPGRERMPELLDGLRGEMS